MKRLTLLVIAIATAIAATPASASMATTGLTIAGTMWRYGTLYTGPCQFTAKLYDAGNNVMGTVNVGWINVVDGQYHTAADFGTTPYTYGPRLWLVVTAQCVGDDIPNVESADEINPVAYALWANNVPSGTIAMMGQGNAGYFGIGGTPAGALDVQGTSFLASQLASTCVSDSDYPTVSLRKALSGTLALKSNYNIGSVSWRGYDGTAYQETAKITAYAMENYTPAARGTALQINTTLTGTTTLAKAATIDGAGNLWLAGTVVSKLVPVPAHNTTNCAVGQVSMDATYLYGCTAANTWHRVTWTAGTW